MKKRKLWFKYPKFFILLLMFLLAYILFRNPKYFPFAGSVVSLGLWGVFIAGLLFSYGFTTPFSIALFMLIAPHATHLWLYALIGGFGAFLSDLLIFSVVRFSLQDEIDRFTHEPLMHYLNHHLSPHVKKYLLPFLGSFIIASPLPDEIGVTLLAASHSISPRIFTFLSIAFNTIGIFVMLLIGKAI